MVIILLAINTVLICASLYMGLHIAESSGLYPNLLLYSLPLLAITIATFLGFILFCDKRESTYKKGILAFYKTSVFIAVLAPALLTVTGHVSFDDRMSIFTTILVVAIFTWIGSFNKFRSL